MSAVPAVGALAVDTVRDQLGEYCGERAGRWSLRPVGAGKKWTTDPANVQPTTVEMQTWVFAHLRAHPDHLSYAEVIERPWVMKPEGLT
ncbi:hypothetical protein [Streptomyces sp. NBC_01506]|uniref:DUF7848 domain-containing protein n=1 Tax=Streptomyces sp. NBC_01506 TaxID=2903887 RepID=UPI00386B835B